VTTRSDAALRASIERLLQGVQVIDFAWRYEYVNETAARHGRTTVGELVGRTMMSCYPGIEQTELFATLERVMLSRRAERLLNEFTSPDGDPGWFELFIDPVPAGICVLSIDVTDRQKVGSELRQAQKMEAVGRLAGGIAHDLSNVLTAILGYAELILDRVHDEEVRDDVRQVQKAGERAGALTRQLLAFSRRQVQLLQVLDINSVVHDLEKLLSRVIREDIRLEVSTDPQLAHTNADPGQIEQVLVNLVVNARDAMPQGGCIRVSTANCELDDEFVRRHTGSSPGRTVVLRVEDSGVGMTPEVLAHIFEPFYTTKGPDKGTGLGMATVYGIVKQSGGYITVDSTLGVGTIVTVYLPATDAPLAGRFLPELTAAGGNETILLVEDDVPIRGLMRKALEQRGYRILDAVDVAAAEEIGASHPGVIHLLVTDIVMPGLNGPNLAQRVLCHRPEMRVLYVSGFPQNEMVGVTLSRTRVMFLAKPFAYTTLLMAVRQILGAAPTAAVSATR
jgi:signal transduction histidine kinase/ActR/RegA family two-component response regulator